MRQSKQPTNTVRRYRQIFSVYMYACMYLCMSAEAVGLGATDDGWVPVQCGWTEHGRSGNKRFPLWQCTVPAVTMRCR